MAYIFFDEKALRNDVAMFAGARSYREIVTLSNGKISLTKAHRIASGKAELKIKDIELLFEVLNTNYDDYIVKHML